MKTGIRGPGYVRPLGERLVNWGTPSVVARATTYFAVASTYRLQGTADQKLATAAEAEARKMLGMRASRYSPVRAALGGVARTQGDFPSGGGVVIAQMMVSPHNPSIGQFGDLWPRLYRLAFTQRNCGCPTLFWCSR